MCGVAFVKRFTTPWGGLWHLWEALGRSGAPLGSSGNLWWAVAGPGGGFLFAAGPLAYSSHAPKDKHICPLLL